MTSNERCLLPISLPSLSGTQAPSLRAHLIVVLREFLFSSLLALPVMANVALYAQNTGEPVAINHLNNQVASPVFLDATQFIESDMCLSIADACGKAGGGSPIPGGTTIDARGFTGNQVCAATSATTMLSSCTSNGGKLLLGLVSQRMRPRCRALPSAVALLSEGLERSTYGVPARRLGQE